jgi:hypothetical protein
MALRTCGPAIITNAMGRIFTRFTNEPPFQDPVGLRLSTLTEREQGA